ncbi:MAG: hypothetical protein AABY11_00175, partial [archaeon]
NALKPAYQKIARYPATVIEKHGVEALTEKPTLYVGTIHSFKGAEADCSPPDEPVLTVNRGYVPIVELDPKVDFLVSFNSQHHKIHRGGPQRPNGYKFSVGSRYYNGPMLTIRTKNSRTRVTPNHILTSRWRSDVHAKHVVYMMYRPDRGYRIGVSTVGGIPVRYTKEKAEALWILMAAKDRKDALYHESLLSNLYGVPELTFVSGLTAKRGLLTDSDLESIWKNLDTEKSAKKLLSNVSGIKSVLFPLLSRYEHQTKTTWTKCGYRRRQFGQRNRWTIRACNFEPDLMEIPTDPGQGQEPEWLPASVDINHYGGTVYSLDVERWKHYISGGAVVHNCVYVFPDLSYPAWLEWEGDGLGPDPIVMQFYVAFTRAREELIICGASGRNSVEV